MADTTITSTFGMDAGPFKRGLADVRNSMQRVGKSVDTTNRSVSRLRAGLGLLKGAAVASGLIAFFRSAFARAEELRGSTDANVEAVLRFKDGIDEAKTGFQDFAVATVGTLNRIGEGLGNVIRLGIDMAKGMSAAESNANMRAALKASEEVKQKANEVAESDKRREADKKKSIEEASKFEKERISQQEQLNRLAEQEAKIRDDAFLRSLSPEELETELTSRLENEDLKERAEINNQIFEVRKKIAQLSEEADNETESQFLARNRDLEEERANLAKLQTKFAESRVKTAEMEVQLAEVQAGIEEKKLAASKKLSDDEDKRLEKVRDRINALREEAAIARTNLAEAQQSEMQARFDRVAPTIAEAAGEGSGRVRRLAQSALRDEERAKRAFLRGNKGEGDRLEERARATRDRLSGIIQTSDSDPLNAVEKNTERAAKALEKILAELTETEVSE